MKVSPIGEMENGDFSAHQTEDFHLDLPGFGEVTSSWVYDGKQHAGARTCAGMRKPFFLYFISLSGNLSLQLKILSEFKSNP